MGPPAAQAGEESNWDRIKRTFRGAEPPTAEMAEWLHNERERQASAVAQVLLAGRPNKER